MNAVTLCQEGLTVKMERLGEQCFLEIVDTPPTRFVAEKSELRAVLLGIDIELANSRGYRCRMWREANDVLVSYGPARILYRSARIPARNLRAAIE